MSIGIGKKCFYGALILFSSVSFAKGQSYDSTFPDAAPANSSCGGPGTQKIMVLKTPAGQSNSDYGKAFFYFPTEAHGYGYGQDVGVLDVGTLQSGFFGFDYGLIIDLGKTDFAAINMSSPAAQTLAEISPASVYNGDESLARKQQQSASEGFVRNGLKIANRAPLNLNDVYVLRSIAYDRSDTLVAMKLIAVNEVSPATDYKSAVEEYVFSYVILNQTPPPTSR